VSPMDYRPLGRTGFTVSALCLGTMTWGRQNSEAEGHAQLDMAVDHGITFIDTAEMYPFPVTKQTFGETERILGTWLAKRGKHDDLVTATKVTGPAARFAYLRDGNPRLDRANIVRAVEASLKRLNIDRIDLYQLHWPERKTNFFGQLGYSHAPEQDGIAIEETLGVLADLVAAGKVRAIGLSNETPWGVHRFLQLAAERDWPRVAAIQNPYSLTNRSFEVGLAEMAVREAVGLLAYSPLAFGTLSGKYLDGARPEGARLSLWWDEFRRYTKPRAEAATRAYVDLARQHGLDPAQMALAFVTSRPFVSSTIIGARTEAQLRAAIDSASLTLAEDVIAGIEAIQADTPNPAP